jgi:hypothetical protein
LQHSETGEFIRVELHKEDNGYNYYEGHLKKKGEYLIIS